MKAKSIFLITAIALGSMMLKAQIYMGKTCDISFFSKGPIEDIYGIEHDAKPIYKASDGTVAIKIAIKSFKFDSKLMEEHFNEKYMESDKYPWATFTGKVNEPFDVKKDGVYNITVTGKLNVHGVDQTRTIPGTVTVKGGEISFDSKFPLALKDHKIEIPTLVAQNIAEVQEITVKALLNEVKK
ncbi:MAG TPA: YceI family protein [Bacteroidia bacterium]